MIVIGYDLVSYLLHYSSARCVTFKELFVCKSNYFIRDLDMISLFFYSLIHSFSVKASSLIRKRKEETVWLPIPWMKQATTHSWQTWKMNVFHLTELVQPDGSIHFFYSFFFNGFSFTVPFLFGIVADWQCI